MSKPFTLSLVIPVYNEQHHLKACLDSIAAQSEKPYEVIIVDNNSTDGSVALAKSYPFVTVIHEKQQGITFARNAGFNAVRGDIIGRIDADSILPDNWVQYMTAYLQKHPGYAISGGSYFYDLKLRNFFGWLQGQVAFRTNRLIMGYYITWGSNMAFHKDMWLAVRDEVHNLPGIHEDIDLGMHLHDKGYQITYHAGLKVGIDSRLFSPQRKKRQQQMKYMKMWPRTLYLHGMKRAWIGWVGVYFIYYSYTPLLLLNRIGSWIYGRNDPENPQTNK